MTSVVALFVALTGVVAVARPPQSPEATLDRAVARYAKVKTVRASFTQTITNPLTGSVVTSKGEVTQRNPGLLSVRWSEPAGDRIVADGKAVWVYLPSTAPGQVIKLLPAQGAGVTPDVTAQFLASPKTRYTVSGGERSAASGRPARALTLIPKSAEMPFTKATIWVDDADALVRQFEVVQHDGVVRRVTITKLAVNVPVDRAQFTFVPPQGVRVVDQTGMGG